ncbi:MAG: YncE family protein [Salipiger marinus]|uniref:YncE family protein n=1 Tax=Salipiger marinus TaxID=555512 RepID=UPI0040593BAD
MSLSMAFRSGVCGLALGALLASTALADPFTDLARGFAGELAAAGENRAPIVPGSTAIVSGEGFAPGQQVVLRQNGIALNDGAAVTADAEGKFSTTVAIPEGTEPGLYPVVAEVSGPAYASTFELKVSPDLPESGSFDVTQRKLPRGLYQVAVTPEALYVTAAVGRPPVKESTLLKLDPQTLDTLAEITPAAAPARADGSEGGVFAVYGVGVDQQNGRVWVTNTRQDTVAVYSAEDLSLVKQFDVDAVPHPRDAVAMGGRVYVSATFEPVVHVFDGATMEELAPITLTSGKRRETFSSATLHVDEATNQLFVVSLGTDEVAVVDLDSGEQTAVYPLPGSKSTIGVGFDPDTGRIFTAAQGSDNVTILDADSGEVVADVAVGANPLNVVYDTQSDLAWVSVRGSGTLVALTAEGEIVGNLPIGPLANHAALDGAGGVYVVNKSRGAEDPSGDQISHVVPKG